MSLELPAVANASFLPSQIPVNRLNQGNTTGGLDTSVTAWESLFGKPQGPSKFHMINPNNISSMNFPDAFKQQSEDLGTAVIMTTFLAPNPMITEISPVKRTEELRFFSTTIEFEPQLAQNAAHRSVPRLYETRETSRTIALSRKLVGHAIEAELATTAYGREYLKRILYQMGMSFAETAALEVMLAIQNSGDIQHKFEDQRVSTGSFMTFVDIMLREIRNFDCGKNTDGKFFARLSATLSEYGKRFRNININTMVTAYAVIQWQNIENQRAEFWKGGERGVTSFENGPFATTEIHGLKVVCPTSQRPGIGMTDDLYTNRPMIGEIADCPVPTSDYKQGDRDIRLLDMHTRRMEVISFHDMITHALLFNPATGRLYDPTDRATIAAYRHHDPRIWDGQGGFSEEQLANTMTIANYAQKNAPVANGGFNWGAAGGALAVPNGTAFEPISFVGELAGRSLTLDNLNTIAKAVEAHFGADRKNKYFQALSHAVALARQAESIDEATITAYIAATDLVNVVGVVRNRNPGTHDTIGTAGAVAAQDIAMASGGDVDIPAITVPGAPNRVNVTNSSLIPGQMSAAGFRATWKALSRGMCNQGADYEQAVHTSTVIAEIYPLLEELANFLHDAFPESLVLNKHLVHNVFRKTEPIDALFQNFIAPDFYPFMTNNGGNITRYPLMIHVSHGSCADPLDPYTRLGPGAPGTALRQFRDVPGVPLTSALMESPSCIRFLYDGAANALPPLAAGQQSFRAHIPDVRAAVGSDILRLRAKEAWLSNSGNILRRVILGTILYARFSQQTLHAMERNDIPAPINFWVASPHTRWIAKQISLLERGANTMVTYMREGPTAMGFQANLRMIYFNVSMHMGVDVRRPDAIVSIHNAFVTTYVCGASTHFFVDPENRQNVLWRYDPFVRDFTGRNSLIVFAVSWNEKLPMFFSLTGTVESSTVYYNTSDFAEAKLVQYNMAPHYCALFGFRNVKDGLEANQNLFRPNQICLRATFDVRSRAAQNGWNSEPGNGHWKGEMNPDVRTITQMIATTVV